MPSFLSHLSIFLVIFFLTKTIDPVTSGSHFKEIIKKGFSRFLRFSVYP
jgi:hypothetical protein